MTKPITSLEGDRLVVIQNGRVFEHELEGVMFRRRTVERDGKEIVLYVALTELEVEKMRQAVSGGPRGHTWKYALIRRVVEDQWMYYPVALVFSNMKERVSESLRSKTKVPCPRWIRRARGRVLEFLQESQGTEGV